MSFFFSVINYVSHSKFEIIQNSHKRKHSSDTAKAYANYDHSFSAHATLACSERVAED